MQDDSGKKRRKMINQVFAFIGICGLVAFISFTAGYLFGRCMECKEAFDYIEHVYEMEEKTNEKN